MGPSHYLVASVGLSKRVNVLVTEMVRLILRTMSKYDRLQRTLLQVVQTHYVALKTTR